MRTSKDLYSVLGAEPTATQEELRDAYVARTRVIHPDRFDRERQAQDWKKANEMLAELNEAYSILRNPQNRAEYDRSQTGKPRASAPEPPPQPRSKPEAIRPLDFKLGELTPGHARYVDLPKPVQERLRRRQENKGEEQFQVRLASVGWNFLFIPVLLCWFWYLFSDTDGTRWTESTVLWYAGLTLTVGLLVGRNVVTIIRWTKATLKPCFYVTPIYFIKTEFDIVSFWPIWTLKDLDITHRYEKGSYQDSHAVLKFEGHDESLSFLSEEQIQSMVNQIGKFDSRLRTEFANGNNSYFREHDDFFRVPRSVSPPSGHLSKGIRLLIYSLFVVFSGVALVAAIALNGQARPFTPAQPLPYSGEVLSFTTAPRVAPFEIKATQGSHFLVKLVDAYGKDPVLTVFVRSGTTVNIDVPLGTYELRYAAGDVWYGYEAYPWHFGPDTAHSKADRTFKFEVVKNRVTGYTVTLYKVRHGNLPTRRINSSDF